MTISDAEAAALAAKLARDSKQEPGRTPIFVGAVAVKNGELLGQASRGEKEHAEYILLEKNLKDVSLAGATIFATLEPCVKRGPDKIPCAQRLIDRKVKKVVIGNLDPNPDIQGKGQLLLRRHNVEIEYFPPDLQAELEDLNRDFFREKRAGTAPSRPTAEFVKAAVKRRLDDWYVAVNATYFHRNFDRSPSSVCLHLIEVIGGLSLLASDKTKPGIDKETQVQKALAWWFALCGKVGVRSVEAMLWDKFPAVCPYCQRNPHNQEQCAINKTRNPGPSWDTLATIGSVKERPTRLGDWQRMFNDIFPVQQGETFGPAFARLSEELAELSEAIRVFPSVPGYFLSEACDVFAWLMKVQNLLDEKNGRRGTERGKALEENVARGYPDACMDCRRNVCACPPILATTIGRITHEVPSGRGSYEPVGRFMTPDKAAELFGPERDGAA